MEKFKKEQIIKELIENFKKAKGAYILNFSKIKTKDLNELRARIKERLGRVQIIKNNLLKIAFRKLGIINEEIEDLKGQTMINFAFEDPISVANILDKFKKDKEENMKIVGGLLNQEWVKEEIILKLAKIPSKEILIGQLIFYLKSPFLKLNYCLRESQLKLVYLLKELKGRQ